MEAEYRYVYDDLTDIAHPDDGREDDPSTRYRVENGRLVYDPEPPPEPSAPRIDEERWGFHDIHTDRIDTWRDNPGESTTTPPTDSVGRQRFRVLDVASWEELKRQEIAAGHLSKMVREMTEQVSTLTRERDEARERAANANIEIAALQRDRDRAYDRVHRGIAIGKRLEARIAHLQAEKDSLEVDLSEARQENARLSEATLKDLERIAKLERQLAELHKVRIAVESDRDDWQGKYEAFVYAVGAASTTICKECRTRFDSEAERLLAFEGQTPPPPASGQDEEYERPRTREEKQRTGLYGKFFIARTDGTSRPGQKHDGCDYFVLDLTHDPHAMPALRAYAESCKAEFPVLAADLFNKLPPLGANQENRMNEPRVEQWMRDAASEIDALIVTNMAIGSLTPVEAIVALIAQHAPPDIERELRELARDTMRDSDDGVEVFVRADGNVCMFVSAEALTDFDSPSIPAAIRAAREAMGR